MTAYAINDFRDAAKYPTRSTLKAWRWEFLRRNAEYQAFFAEHNVGGYVPGCERFGVTQLVDPRDDLDSANEESAAVVTLAPGIVTLPTHASIDQRRRALRVRFSSELALQNVLDFTSEIQSGTNVVAVLDRALPIEDQLAAIRRTIERMNADERVEPIFQRPHVDKWPSYLRILDGRAQGATFSEIAGALHPGESEAQDKTRKAFDAAIRLTQTFGVGRAVDGENKTAP